MSSKTRKKCKPEFDVDADVDVMGSLEYIYLVQNIMSNSEDGHKICKIGKTTRLHNRFIGYPAGTRLYLIKRVKNCNFVEDEIKRLFGKYFTHELKYGIEYYSGDVDLMIDCIEKIIATSDQEVEDHDTLIRIRSYYKDRVVIAIGKHDMFDDDSDDSDDVEDVEDDEDDVEDDDIEDDSDDDIVNVKKKKSASRFVCQSCDKSFTTNQSLIYHTKNEACKINNYFCKHCEKGFTLENSMYRHAKYNCKIKKEKDEKDKHVRKRLLRSKEKVKMSNEKVKEARKRIRQLEQQLKKE
jgi:hypothetical protein